MTKKQLSEKAILQLERENSIQIKEINKGYENLLKNVKERKKEKRKERITKEFNSIMTAVLQIVIISFTAMCFCFGFIAYLKVMGTPTTIGVTMFAVAVSSIMTMYVFIYVANLEEKKKSD